MLRRLIRGEGDSLTNGIIFCNRKVDVDIVAKSLKRHGFDAEAMHGDLDQKLRMAILQRFRDGELKLLIASDVAARGLDIPNVSHIFNFDVPIHSEDYVHRIGRTGRAGRWGKSITLCLPFEEKYLAKIEELVKKRDPGRWRARSPPTTASPPPRASPPAPPRRARRAQPRPALASRARSAEPPRSRPRRAAARRARAARPSRAAAEPRRAEPRRAARAARAPPVAGMGDHVPAFLLRELRIDTAEPEPEPTSRAPIEPAADAAEAAAPEPAERRPAPPPPRAAAPARRTEADAA